MGLAFAKDHMGVPDLCRHRMNRNLNRTGKLPDMMDDDMSEIENGPPLILGIDFTLGRPEPVDLRLAFNTLSDEEFDAAFGTPTEKP